MEDKSLLKQAVNTVVHGKDDRVRIQALKHAVRTDYYQQHGYEWGNDEEVVEHWLLSYEEGKAYMQTYVPPLETVVKPVKPRRKRKGETAAA